MSSYIDRRPFWSRGDRESYESPTDQQRAVYNSGRRALYQFHVREGRTRDVIDFEVIPRPAYIGEDLEIERGEKPTPSQLGNIAARFASIQEQANNIPTLFQKGAHEWRFAKAQINGTLWYA